MDRDVGIQKPRLQSLGPSGHYTPTRTVGVAGAQDFDDVATPDDQFVFGSKSFDGGGQIEGGGGGGDVQRQQRVAGSGRGGGTVVFIVPCAKFFQPSLHCDDREG